MLTPHNRTTAAAPQEEARELRRQMGQAKALKDTSQPEFDEKLNRLKQYKDMRQGYNQRMGGIKDGFKGLDCKSEEELDAKIRELEHKVSHEGDLALREEKQIVQQISKLNSQRAKVREYGAQKSSLTELESDSGKVKAVIKELEEEVDILKAERDSAQKIITEILDKLRATEKDLKELEDEQTEAVKAKNDTLEALQRAREEMDSSMKDYRENRKFSLQIRDMVAANQVDEARVLCEQQVDELLAKLGSDQVFKAEYLKLWCTQRKSAVSELLPGSAPSSSAAAPAGKPGARGAAAPAPPQGKEKAQSIIAQIMEQSKVQASRELLARQAAAAASDEEEVEEEDEPVVLEPMVLKPAAVVRSAPKPAAKAEVYKVELPDIKDEAFELPASVKDADDKVGKDADTKDRLREEQKAKAAEAEARKKRLAETKEKKKAQAQANDAVRKEVSRQAAVEAVAEPVVEEPSSTEVVAAAAAAAAAASSSKASKPFKTRDSYSVLKTQTTASAKRPKGGDSVTSAKFWKALYNRHGRAIAVAILALILAVCVIVALMYSK